MAVVAPMPRARVMIATEVNPGLLRNMRRPKRRSCARSCSQFILRISRHLLFVRDRKSTRLNSSHSQISYAVFCLKKKKTTAYRETTGRKAGEAGRGKGMNVLQ